MICYSIMLTRLRLHAGPCWPLVVAAFSLVLSVLPRAVVHHVFLTLELATFQEHSTPGHGTLRLLFFCR